MNYLNSIIRSPLSVKLLFAIYAYSLYKYGSQLLQPEVIEKLGYSSTLIHMGISIVLIALIVLRVWWSWIAGISECTYFAAMSAYALTKGNHIISSATESALQNPATSKLTPEQLKMGMSIGFYGGLGLVIAGGLVTAILWYKSRFYFESKTA
ncbi:hypothetical protein [Bdellovibrio sp. HCB337]|uniref:hypothetical protein n=1 Tax=Bdellovibrio sp. HCB337 TaxID=3394358 RepID=UPI0039A6BD0D